MISSVPEKEKKARRGGENEGANLDELSKRKDTAVTITTRGGGGAQVNQKIYCECRRMAKLKEKSFCHIPGGAVFFSPLLLLSHK